MGGNPYAVLASVVMAAHAGYSQQEGNQDVEQEDDQCVELKNPRNRRKTSDVVPVHEHENEKFCGIETFCAIPHAIYEGQDGIKRAYNLYNPETEPIVLKSVAKKIREPIKVDDASMKQNLIAKLVQLIISAVLVRTNSPYIDRLLSWKDFRGCGCVLSDPDHHFKDNWRNVMKQVVESFSQESKDNLRRLKIHFYMDVRTNERVSFGFGQRT